MEPTSTSDASQTTTTPVEPGGMLPVSRELIVRTPGTCWGKPRIAGTRIKTVSYGEECPLVKESNETAWSQNRRAEFRILYGGADAVQGTTAN